MSGVTDVLEQIEQYYDAVPRTAARVEEIGPFTLFVSTAGWPYYARPRLDGPDVFSAADVTKVRDRQRELGVPEAFEWVHQTTPGLLRPAREAGLVVAELPLQVLAGDGIRAPVPPDVTVRLLGAADPALGAAQAVAAVGFRVGGTAIGSDGTNERDAAVGRQSDPEHHLLRDRIKRGITVVAVAEDDSGPIGIGSHQPVAGVTEVVGVATLPVARRRGIGAAITAALVADARERGVETVFLSAGSDDVARIYQRVGFERVATACIAEPAATA